MTFLPNFVWHITANSSIYIANYLHVKCFVPKENNN